MDVETVQVASWISTEFLLKLLPDNYNRGTGFQSMIAPQAGKPPPLSTAFCPDKIGIQSNLSKGFCRVVGVFVYLVC